MRDTPRVMADNTTTGSTAVAAPRRTSGRSILAALFWLLSCLAILVGGVTLWAHQTLLTSSGWGGIVAGVASDEEVIAATSEKLVDRVSEALGVQERVAQILPGEGSLLAAPITSAVEDRVADRVADFAATEQFQDAFVAVNERAHEAAMKVIRDGGGEAHRGRGVDPGERVVRVADPVPAGLLRGGGEGVLGGDHPLEPVGLHEWVGRRRDLREQGHQGSEGKGGLTFDLTDQVLSLPAGERYSFIFSGSAQVLDHALTTVWLDPFVRDLEYGRGNADAPVDRINDPASTLRSSDHDGLVLFVESDDDGVPDPELSASDAEDIAFFMAMLAGPPRLDVDDQNTESVARGSELFSTVGCAACHVPTLPSSLGDVPLFSDLLLHEILPAGSTGIADGDASPREFRTPPLWGLRSTPPYLHDGRADTIDQAIRAHAGEALRAVVNYFALTPADRVALLEFLNSL